MVERFCERQSTLPQFRKACLFLCKLFFRKGAPNVIKLFGRAMQTWAWQCAVHLAGAHELVDDFYHKLVMPNEINYGHVCVMYLHVLLPAFRLSGLKRYNRYNSNSCMIARKIIISICRHLICAPNTLYVKLPVSSNWL